MTLIWQSDTSNTARLIISKWKIVNTPDVFALKSFFAYIVNSLTDKTVSLLSSFICCDILKETSTTKRQQSRAAGRTM